MDRRSMETPIVARAWLDGFSCLGELLALCVASLSVMAAHAEWQRRRTEDKWKKR